MQSKVVVVDLGIGGAVPVSCNLSVSDKDLFIITMEELSLEVWVKLKDISELFSGVIDGS